MRREKVLVKVGGSVIREPEMLEEVLSSIEELKEDSEIMVVPGGGEMADRVRELDERYGLSSHASHWMAIQAMDINAQLLSDISGMIELTDPGRTGNISSEKIPVVRCQEYLREKDELPESWKVTSDSIALYIAEKIGADRVVLVKDVEGIFGDFHKREGLIREMEVSELYNIDQECVDSYFKDVKTENVKASYIVSGSSEFQEFVTTGEGRGTILRHQK